MSDIVEQATNSENIHIKNNEMDPDQTIKQRIIAILGDEEKRRKLEEEDFDYEHLLKEPIDTPSATEEEIVNLIAQNKISELDYELLLSRIPTPVDYNSDESIQGLLNVLQAKPELLDIIASLFDVPDEEINIHALRAFIYGQNGFPTAYHFEKEKTYLLRDVALNLGNFDVPIEKRKFSYSFRDQYEPLMDVLEVALYGAEQEKWAKILIGLQDKGLEQREKMTGKKTERLTEADKINILNPKKESPRDLPLLEDSESETSRK